MFTSLEIQDLYGKSNNDVAVELGRRFKSLRVALRLSQKDVSEQSGVSTMTIVRFERGEGTSIRLDNLIALMRAVQKLESIYDMIPEIPESLYSRQYRHVGQRVRLRNDEK